MTKRIMIDINIQELEEFLKQNKMTFAKLAHKMFSSISYFTHVKKQKKMMQVKYKTMVEVLGVPYGTFAISDVTKVQNSQEKRQVRNGTMVKINFDELENHLNSISMTFSRLSMIMNSGHSYFSNVRYQQDCKMSNNKYRQMLYVLNLPMGTFIVERSPETETEPEPRIIIHGHSAICQALDSENSILIHKINHLHRTMGEMIIKLEENNKLIHTYSDYENSKGDNLNG